MSGPSLGPDNYYHLVWVWRDSYLCETNNHLSYARSRNLKDWESAAGERVELPITIEQKELWVDPIPIKAGLINGGAKVGFDNKNRLLITYHKFDENGNNQAYIARFNHGKWEMKQISNWNYRWYFSGGGGIAFEIIINGVQKYENNLVKIGYNHIKYGEGYWLVDEDSLKVVETVTQSSPAKKEISGAKDDLVMRKKVVNDCGKGYKGKKFSLEWETLPQNRDKARVGVYVEPTILKVIEETVQ